jgi:cephalosporin hydroxylase
MPRIENALDMTLRELMEHLHHRLVFDTKYQGIGAMQSVFDFWKYQELLWFNKPDVVIEIGNYVGGSTLALAHLLDNLDRGRLIGLDLDHSGLSRRVVEHPRISLVEGEAVANLEKVSSQIAPGETVMIIEDSAHTYDNTLAILEAYGPLVTPGQYFIVEDTICRRGVDDGPAPPNAYEAVEAFVARHPEFEIDRDCEAFIVTWNPKGYLRRRTEASAGAG